MKKQIELLAPAGSRDALHAAVENGADAIYLGGKLFSARAQADNFDIDVLKEELQYAHARGASIYLTMNTLVSDAEMEEALKFAVQAYSAGIDGIIVQDIGLAAALHRIMPDMPLHASTQMTIYDMAGVQYLEKMGLSRVVLARELSLEEMSEIAQNTPLEVEAFIHGALCVCYSGQCLMSSMIGGRSGNRGKCAQPCRLPYELVGKNHQKDSRPHHIGSDKTYVQNARQRNVYQQNARQQNVHQQNGRYLLSPKDICSLDFIGDIVASGIHSLKIEGRMKSPEYVATVVRIYRKYIDIAIELMNRGEPGQPEIDEADRHDLLQIFNRGGFSEGYMKGKAGADMMSYEKPNNSGIYLGKAAAYDSSTRMVSIRLEDRLTTGDGIEVWTGSSDSPGGTITAINKGKTVLNSAEKGDLVSIGYIRGRIALGDGVYKTTDIVLNKSARESFSGRSDKRIEITGQASLKSGQPLELSVDDYNGHSTTTVGSVLPQKAINKPLTPERLKEQLGKTGATPFTFSDLQVDIENDLTIPVSEINEVRRQALNGLLEARADRYAERRSDEGISARLEEMLQKPSQVLHDRMSEQIDTHKSPLEAQKPVKPAISLFYYWWDKSINLEDLGADRIYLPFMALDRPGFRDSVSSLKKEGVEVFGWMPSITRGNYEEIIKRFLAGASGKTADIGNTPTKGNMVELGKAIEFDGILAGNIGTFSKYRDIGIRMAGDISLNLYNALSVHEAAKIGLESAALSVEMTLKQVHELASFLSYNISPDPSLPVLEAAVYGRLPLMVSEYCPVGCMEGGFKRSFKCSGSCGKGEYSLKDRLGIEFPVLSDNVDCRSTILNSNVLFIPDGAKSLRQAGIGIFRLYILDEKPEDVKKLVRLFRAAVVGKHNDSSVYNSLIERIKTAGFTKGHYYRGV